MVQAGPNPGLELLGYLITMVSPRRTVHQLYEERLRAAYGADVFDARIPEAADFVEAIARRLPIAMHKPKGAARRRSRPWPTRWSGGSRSHQHARTEAA